MIVENFAIAVLTKFLKDLNYGKKIKHYLFLKPYLQSSGIIIKKK